MMQNNQQKRRRYQKDPAPSDDIITLIHLVRQNPALYNYKLQPNQRRRSDILNGWAQIAAGIGNKYTVEECRRKWKNLRDTYHQYRLRKPKISDGLSKWRYAKDMEFLSGVYQPKLKSNRTQSFNTTTSHDGNLMHSVSESNDDHDDQVVHQDMVHSSMISVGDNDTFILTAYEDVTHDNDVSHEDPQMVSHSELNHDHNSMEDCVKHEQQHALEDDGNTGAEVDYEEVCLYEESGNAPSVDCETIIGGPPNTNSANSDDTKFQYLDANDFCIASMNPSRSQYSSSASSVIGASGTLKLKSLPMVTSSTNSIPSTSNNTLDTSTAMVTIPSSSVHNIQSLPELTRSPSIAATSCTSASSSTGITNKADSHNMLESSAGTTNNNHGNGSSGHQPPPNYHSTAMISQQHHHNHINNMQNNSLSFCHHQREECDLFFDFLKKKIQRFPAEEITSIQVEFLNCVLRREAEHTAQKAAQQRQQL